MCEESSQAKQGAAEDDEETMELGRNEETPHEQIDRYRLLHVIGSGGFGSVWQAEQKGPIPRRVALKVVKPGMDTREVIAQFEAERQLLALMDHPCIAKVYDAGATREGLPYFVMELVGGIPITKFCDRHRLSLTERLRLFVEVCKALQHAHQKGVSHRDIKPSNILVCEHDGKPQPKVIDFGIAKATRPLPTDVTPRPAFEQLIGTPVYMSPEQAAGNIDIDTRCDVYALGVLLYELLTGCTPFDQKALEAAGEQDLWKMIDEVVPEKPSERLAAMPKGECATLAARLRSSPSMLTLALREDLDWIVMKAMQKDRNQRYETANGLAMDVERYLMSEPVVARPANNRYRLSKLVNRNRLLFTMGTLVGVALMVGISISGMQTYRIVQAEREHDRLRAQAEQSERRANEEKEAARRALARAQIALADAAYRDQDGGALQAALQAVPVELRDSNWHYLMEKSDTSFASIQVPGGAPVERVLPHPVQAGVFITVSSDYWVSITKLGSAATLLSFQLGFEDRSTSDFCLTISPDGEQLAAAKSSGGGILVHNLKDGKVVARWDDAGTDELIYSPDGKRLLDIAHGGPAHMRLARTGEVLWTAEGSETMLLAAFDRTGRQLVCDKYKATGGQKLQIINAFDGSVLRELSVPRTRLTALAISPNGRQVMTGDQRGFVRSIDLQSGGIRYEFRANDRAVSALAHAPDGREFITLSNLSGGRQSIQVWDAATGIFLQPLLNAGSTGRDICVHPVSGEVVASGTTAKAWRLKGLNEEFRLAARDVANTCFWNSDDLIFAHGPNTGMDLINLNDDDAASHPLWHSADKNARIVTASTDGAMAAVASTSKSASDIQLLKLEMNHVVELQHLTAPGGLIFMHFDPTGERLLVRAASAFYVFDAGSGHSTTIPWDKAFVVREAAWIGTSPRIIALLAARTSRSLPGSEDRLLLFDAISGECLKTTLNASVINAIATSPDGSVIAEGGADRMVRLRNTQTLAVTRELRVHDSPIMALAFHPAGLILATASEDLTIKLWSLVDGRLLEELTGPVGPPRQLAFSLNGRRLACLSGDRSMRIWNLDSFAGTKKIQ